MRISKPIFIASVLTLALGATLSLSSRASAADPPDPDLTGDWLGYFVTDSDPDSVGEAFLHVDPQVRHRITGRLGLDLFRFDINGSVTADPPDPDADPPDPDADPPDPDLQLRVVGSTHAQPRQPATRILIRGRVTPESERSAAVIVADFLIVGANGGAEWGTLILFQLGSR